MMSHDLKGQSKQCLHGSWLTSIPCFSRVVFDGLTSWLQAAVSMLKQDYKEGEMTLSSALALAVKVLNKTMDVSKLSAEKGEVHKYFLSFCLLVLIC